MRRRTAWTTISIIVATATACGGTKSDPFIDLGDGVDPLVTVGSPSEPTASVPTTTVTPTVVAPTTVPPTSVPSPGGETADTDAVGLGLAATAFAETAEAAVACLAAPADCDPGSVAAPGGPAHERFARLVATFHEAGYLVRHLPDVTGSTVESGEVVDAQTVVATVCDVDGDVVVEPGDSNGFGLDLIVNDLVVARRVRVELRLTAAGWRRWSVEQLGEWPMERACGDS